MQHHWFFMIASLLLLAVWNSAANAEAPPPNIVLIYADDLGYGDLGCYGAKGWTTPHLDQLAKAGTRFTNFYTAQAVCSASRTALLTGCYPNRLGMLGALNPSSKHGIHADETTIAEMLKARGYATAIFGKWHLGHHPQFLPTRHGFDEYFGLPYSNDMWPRHPTARFPELPLIDMEKTVQLQPDQSKLTTQYTERAVRFIEKSKDRPFFLYLPQTMPHVPIFVSDKFKGKSLQGLYGDVIMEIDWSVGQIVATLEKHGLNQNTLVIFSSDNGPWLSYGNHAGSAGGFREGKGTTFEGGLRIPCIMRWPGKVPADRVCHDPAMTIDILPTLARLAGAELPKLPIDGLDISPIVLAQPGAKCPHEAFDFYWGNELQAVRAGQWKLHFPHDYQSLTGIAGQDGKPGGYSRQRIELSLYDLENDHGEKANVAEKHPEVVEKLKALADKARTELGDSAQKKVGTGFRPPGQLVESKEEKEAGATRARATEEKRAVPVAPALVARLTWDPIESYEERRLEGWRILLHKSLREKEHDDLRERTLKVLAQQLYDIARVVPAEPLAKLRTIPIWIELAHPRHPCMCYHPSPVWLRSHHMNPEKAGSVELANCKSFLAWTLDQPWMVLHELAHGYHHQKLGYDHAEIAACFERAKTSKTYDSVLHINGQKRRHYALSNDREYFAELTESFFGTNDFFPFVRSELKEHDPAGYELMQKVWGKNR